LATLPPSSIFPASLRRNHTFVAVDDARGTLLGLEACKRFCVACKYLCLGRPYHPQFSIMVGSLNKVR
jgi:hypothetical protein